jgi:putative DNA primase/helicase
VAHYAYLDRDNLVKLVIVGNHRPALGNVDDAMRRRLHLVPFEQKPANPDRELESKLLGELPAIMSWAIDGCAMWQRVGLAPPPAVVDATEEYLSTEDAVGEWLAECCVLKPYASAATSKLFESWREFAEARGERVGTINVLSEALKKRGFRPTRSTGGQRNVRGFEGVDLISPPAKPDRRTGERDYADAH